MSATDQIEHVIMVVFENRSFDHLLGWMSHPKYGPSNTNVEGLVGDVDVSTGELANPAYHNPALLQTFRPFFANTDEPLADDLPHGRDGVNSQLAFTQVTNSYAMQGFAASYFQTDPAQAGPFTTKPDCMRMLGPEAAPVTAWLAKNYCVCDHWFTPIPTDTHPNRMMAIAGYTEIESTGSIEPNEDIFTDWADRNNVPWRVYSDDFSFMTLLGDRSLEVLKQRALPNGMYRSFSRLASDYQNDSSFPAITLIEPSFLDDPLAGSPNDNHPPLQIGHGEAFLAEIYTALTATPAARERFGKTMLLVYYDEHGGFFDHVPPLSVMTTSGQVGSVAKWPAFVTSGPRIPALVVSPLVEAGSVFKGNLDHTSVLRFFGERFSSSLAYSPEVTARHGGSVGLCSVGDAITRTVARVVPTAPNFGRLPAVPKPVLRGANTNGQQAFLTARQRGKTQP